MFSRSNWAKQRWVLLVQGDLEIEHQQAVEEGRDISSVEKEFDAIKSLDLAIESNQQRAEALLDIIQTLPVKSGYAYHEPSDLAGIRNARPALLPLEKRTLSDQELLDKALGAWQGRVSGCLLGKPVEGCKSYTIEKYLKAQGRWPLNRYFSFEAPAELRKEMGWENWGPDIFDEGLGKLQCMPGDDDTNYTMAGIAVIKQNDEFSPETFGMFWLNNIPGWNLCTAERIAYKNMLMAVPPPMSASYRNVYREWIGAQIRADGLGYVCPGDPEKAAALAWCDAAISHVKNGIYGEMWVAAMLAAAYVCDDILMIIKIGLAQVPAKSRFTENINKILQFYKEGKTYDQVIADFRTRWNEENAHHWVHTISNAEIVAIALLWGKHDFEKSICYSVSPGFDTDCNGATVGSIVGMIIGARRMPPKWVCPWNDTLCTDVKGYSRVAVTKIAEETVELTKKKITVKGL